MVDPEATPPPEQLPAHGAVPAVAPIIAQPTPSLSTEPPARRLRQFGLLAALTVLVVVCAVWLLASYHHQTRQADANAKAADRLCKQVTALGQPCAAQPAPDGVSTPQAVVPIPAVSASLTPVTPGAGAPTDESGGVPQAYQPGPDSPVVAISAQGDRLILTYADGARVDAGPVDLATLAIVLRAQLPASPSASPSPSPAERMPPGDMTPEPTWTSPPPDFQAPGDLESETP